MQFFIFNVVVEVSCIIEIFLNSHMSYIDMSGDEILDQKEIWKHYLKGGLFSLAIFTVYKNFSRKKKSKSEIFTKGPSAKYDQLIRVSMVKINENAKIRSVKKPI